MAAGRGLGDCSSKIIGAHTISRSASLARIAVDGHVYSTHVSFAELDKTGGKVRPVRLGINRTSIFRGFCDQHDRELFKRIDAPEPIIDAEFCEIAAFRACAKELYLKQQLIASDEDLMFFERGMPPEEWQLARALFTGADEGRHLAVTELEAYVASLAYVLAGDRANDWVHLVVRMKGGLMPVLVSAPFQPTSLPNGAPLQDLGDPSQPCQSVVISAVATENGGAFVLSCRSIETKAMAFVDAVRGLDADLVPKFLVGLIFEMAENIAIAPKWWQSLSAGFQSLVTTAMNRGISPFGQQSRESNAMAFAEMPFSGEFEIEYLASDSQPA